MRPTVGSRHDGGAGDLGVVLLAEEHLVLRHAARRVPHAHDVRVAVLRHPDVAARVDRDHGRAGAALKELPSPRAVDVLRVVLLGRDLPYSKRVGRRRVVPQVGERLHPLPQRRRVAADALEGRLDILRAALHQLLAHPLVGLACCVLTDLAALVPQLLACESLALLV